MMEELFPFVVDAIPGTQPFVLLAESFSTPLAVRLAATNPASLKGLVICAGFIRNPVRGWLRHTKILHTSLFRVSPPRFVIEHFLIGAHAPRELRNEVRRALRSVSPAVAASRVQAVMACDVSAQLLRVRVPILYLQADNDRLVGKSSFQEIQELKPDTTLVSIAAAHFVCSENHSRRLS
jgi:pimeloyl-ACP methyl ester carboxylesterase